MKIREKLKNISNQSRRGSALIITLGILSLLLIVCMVFAFDARSQRKAAFNHAAAIRARLVNESGFKRSIGILDDLLTQGTFMTDHTFLNPASKFYPGTGNWAGTKYLPTLTTGGTEFDTATIDSAYYAAFSTGSSIEDYTDSATFIDEVTSSATWATIESDSIIGNYTYLIIDKTGQLPPEYVGNVDPSPFTGEISDINIGNAGIATPANYTVDADKCFGLADYYRNGISLDSSMVLSLICPGMVPEAEAFWFPEHVDNGAGSEYAYYDTEVFERMDITKADGTTITAQQMFNFLINSYSADSTIQDSTKSLWLSKSNATDLDGASSDKLARRYAARMVLNMLDYQDADGKASAAYVINDGAKATLKVFTDQADATFDATSPDANTESIVYGVEDSWGISEILVKVKLSDYVAAVAPSTYANANATVTIDLELFNPIQTNSDTPKVELSFFYAIGSSSGTKDTTVDIAPTVPSFTTTSPAVSAGAQGIGKEIKIPVQISVGTAPMTHAAIYIRSIKIMRSTGSEIFRTYPVNTEGSATAAPVAFAFLSSTGSVIDASAGAAVSYKAKSRENDVLFMDVDLSDTANYAKLWEVTTGVANTTFDLADETLSGGNTLKPYTSFDYADVTAPGVGGAKAAFERIADLGRLHSPYKPNQSIRLWNADSDVAGDGEWVDAYLLDMFKAGDQSEARKVNINTPSDNVIAAIFTPFVTTLTGAGLSTSISDVQDHIKKLNGTDASGLDKPCIYRGDLYRIFDKEAFGQLHGDTTADEETEEAIEKVIELLGTRQNYYHIITASRSVKDMGAINRTVADAVGAVKISDTNYGKIEASYKTLTEVYRDAWKRESKILRINVLED